MNLLFQTLELNMCTLLYSTNTVPYYLGYTQYICVHNKGKEKKESADIIF